MKVKILFKQIALLLLAVLLCPVSEVLALTLAGQELEITVSDAYVSRYIWRGQDLFGDNDGANQPSIDFTFPKLFYGTDLSLNVWGSFPVTGGHEDSEELDYTVSFSRDFMEEAFNISVGNTYYDYPNTSSTADVNEPWLSFTWNELPFLPLPVSMTLFGGYDFKARFEGPEEGWYFSWGFDTELPLPAAGGIFQEGQTVALGVVNWGQDGVAGLTPSSLYSTELSASTTYAAGSFTFTPNMHYSFMHEDTINGGKNELWGGLEVSYAF
jgi:hypothetical protein